MVRIAKKTGVKEPLDEGKLWDSLYWPAREAHYSDEDAVELADEAKNQLVGWIHDHDDNVVTTREIREKAVEVLGELDEDVSFMYEKHLDIN